MNGKFFLTAITLMIMGMLFVSCQKEINGVTSGGGGVVIAGQKPKVGTTWTYRYYTYYQLTGGLATSAVLTYRAKSEENLGGEQWLKIVDVAADTTVWLLNEKAGGLYQYINGNSYLLCEFPAQANDSYNSYNEGQAEMFTVKSVNAILPTGIGDIPVNYYEAFVGTQIMDLFWYNENVWLARKSKYINKSVLTPSFFLYSTLFLDSIVY